MRNVKQLWKVIAWELMLAICLYSLKGLEPIEETRHSIRARSHCRPGQAEPGCAEPAGAQPARTDGMGVHTARRKKGGNTLFGFHVVKNIDGI